MEKYNKRHTLERILLISFLFIIQIIWFIFLFSNIVQYSVWMNASLLMISVIMIMYLLRKNESPAYRMGWISLMVLFPMLGGLLYLLIGNKRPTKNMKRNINNQISKYIQELQQVSSQEQALKNIDVRAAGISHYLKEYECMPVFSHTQVEYYASGETVIDQIVKDLQQAKKYIFIEFFIIDYGHMYDKIFDVLKEKAKQGIDVRLIYDDFGCIARLPKNFDQECESLGIKTVKFNPVKPFISMAYNTRDHRKFIIIDGQVGYSGGMNIADEYINVIKRFGYWKDNMIRMVGPGVWGITNLFLHMWNAFYEEKDKTYHDFRPWENQADWDKLFVETAGYVQSFGDSPLDQEALGENIYRSLIDMATTDICIYTPYLVISYELQTSLELAAKRGVRVRIITPGIPDKPIIFRITRSYYRPLLEVGCEIYEFSPGFLHAKTIIVDGTIAMVGTINLDYRSLYLHFETATLMYYHPVVKEIQSDFEESVAQSRQIAFVNLNQSIFGEMFDSILRLFAPFV